MQVLQTSAMLAGGLVALAAPAAFVPGVAVRRSSPSTASPGVSGPAISKSPAAAMRLSQGALLAVAVTGGAFAGTASVSARRGYRGATAARAGEQEIQRLREELSSVKEKEALIKFRMTAAEQAEKQLGDRVMKIDEEKTRVAALLKDVEEKVARAHAEAEAKVTQVKMLAEEERKRLVAAVLAEARKEDAAMESVALGRGAVLSMLTGIESQANRASNSWYPHTVETVSYSGGYVPW